MSRHFFTKGELGKAALKRVLTVPFRYYWDTFKPMVNEAPVCGDLADELADIWLDLWEGLQLIDSGYAHDAIYHWRLLYDSHWGQHLLGTQRAIDAFLRE